MMTQLSISQRLHENLGKVIAATNPGERLPSEPDLAKQLGVSRATLREAMRTFETQGVIRRRQGSGTYVVQPPPVIESGLEVLESIDRMTSRIGLPVAMSALQVTHQPSNLEEAKALGIRQGDGVVYLSRVILAEGHPAAFLIDILPDDILDIGELGEDFTGSVLDLLLRKGSPALASSRCEINAVTASSEVSRAMGIQRGDVLLRFVSYLYTTTGRVVDYSFSYFLPGYFRFHVVRRVD